MTWWMVLLGAVMMAPVVILVIVLYVLTFLECLEIFYQDNGLTSDEASWRVIFWLLHLAGLTIGGWFVLATGLGW